MCILNSVYNVQLCSHMRGEETGWFWHSRSATKICSHIRGADAGGSVICWGQRTRGFEADAENWLLDPFVAERILLPLRLRFATAYVWTYVMICVEVNYPPASSSVRSLRMCESALTHVFFQMVTMVKSKGTWNYKSFYSWKNTSNRIKFISILIVHFCLTPGVNYSH